MIDAVPVIVVTGVVVVFVAYFWLRSATRRLKLFEAHADEFFSAAQKLASDRETPDWVLGQLRLLSVIICQQRTAWILLRVLLSHGRIASNGRGRMSQLRREQPALADLLGTAAVHSFLAASYYAPVAGWVVRKLVLFSPSDDKARAELLAENVLPNGAC